MLRARIVCLPAGAGKVARRHERNSKRKVPRVHFSKDTSFFQDLCHGRKTVTDYDDDDDLKLT